MNPGSQALDTGIDLGKRLWHQIQVDDLSGRSAELAYRFMLAIFPFGLFLLALASFASDTLGVDNPTNEIMGGIKDNLPAGLGSAVRPELEQVLGQHQPGLVSLGAVLALWAATSGTITVMKAMNLAYDVKEDRPIVIRYALGVGLTIAGSVGILLAFVTIVGGAVLTEQFVGRFGFGDAWGAIELLRWPVVFMVLVAVATVLYRIAPNMQPSWTAAIKGALIFAAGWMLATIGFSLYVANVADYGATYGVVGGFIVLMLWLYLTGFVMLLAAEIVALIVEREEPERLRQRQAATGAERVVEQNRRDALRALDRVGGTGEAS